MMRKGGRFAGPRITKAILPLGYSEVADSPLYRVSPNNHFPIGYMYR